METTRTERGIQQSIDATLAGKRLADFRDTCPFTWQQVAQAWLDEAGRWYRDGHPFKGDIALRKAEWVGTKRNFNFGLLRPVLEFLIADCLMCGKPAHRRFGWHGFCREHAGTARSLSQYYVRSTTDIKAAYRERERLAKDYATLRAANLAKTRLAQRNARR